MAKTRDPEVQATDQEAREKAPWVTLAKASIHTARPVKKGIYLTEDARKRVETAALVEGLHESNVLDALIRTYLKGYFSGYRKDSKEADAESLPRGQNEAA